MIQSDKTTSYLGIASDIKPYPLIHHLKKHFSFESKESELMIDANIVNQIFMLENDQTSFSAYLIVLSLSSTQSLKINKGIDYLLYTPSVHLYKDLKLSLRQLDNKKGIFDLNCPKLQHLLPPENQLISFKPKKIAVN